MNPPSIGKNSFQAQRLFFVGAVIAISLAFAFSSQAQVREEPEDILLFGFKAYQDGFYDPAADALGKYLRLRPGSPRAATVRYLHAEALRKSERFKEAIVAYRKFLARHGKDGRAVEVRFRLAGLLEKTGDPAGALRNYLSVKKGELHVEAVYRVAEFYLKYKKWEEASSALTEFISLAPKDTRVESALYERAKALDHLKQYEKAEVAYRTAVKRFPESDRSVAAMRRLSFLQLRLKRFSDAEKSLKNFLKRAPRQNWEPDIQLAMAASYFGQKKYSWAAKAFEGMLSLRLSEKQRRSARRGVAESWWNAENFWEAAKAYRRAMENSPEGGIFLSRYLHSLHRSNGCVPSGGGSLRYALEVLEGRAELGPGDQLLLANCLEKAGMETEAVEIFESVIRSSPNRPVGIAAGLRVAEFSEASGRPEEAATRYENLLKAVKGLKESDKIANRELLKGVYLGVLRMAEFRFQAEDCGSAVELASAVPRELITAKAIAEVASLLGECAYRKGRLEEAELQFGRVLVGRRRPELAARARVRLAAIAKARGDKKESLRRLQEALPLLPEPMRREARLEAGQLLREMGKVREGRKMLLPFALDEKVDAKRRRSVWLILAQDSASAGKWDEADKALENWSALDPPNSREVMSLWTTVLYRVGKCPQALGTARKALEESANHPAREELLRITVSCLIESQRHSEALAVLKEIASLSPGDAEVAYQMGSLYERNEMAKEAMEVYGTFLGKFPDHPRTMEAALRLGFLESREGKRESALKAYRIAARSPRPRIAEPARYHIALDMEERGKVESALAEYEKLAVHDLTVSKWRRAASWRAAALREQRKEWKRAIGHYKRISRISSSNSDESKSLVQEARQAAARAQKLRDYLDRARNREEKMRNRVPFVR